MTHHPSNELLQKFAYGELDTATAVLLSAHVGACSSCLNSVNAFEQGFSEFWLGGTESLARRQVDVATAWENMRASLRVRREERVTQPPQTKMLTVRGHRFEVPRALDKLLHREIKWAPLGKGGQIAKLGTDQGKKLFLIYLPAKESVPHHSHRGEEYSYVIAGRFSAGGEIFETGDFAMCDSGVSHAPTAGGEDGCLLVSSINGRLNFLKGWFSPFNGILWWAINLRT